MRRLTKIIGILDKVGVFSRWTNIIGIAALFLMIFLNFIDTIMDVVIFHRPIKGVTEITEIMMICGISLALAHCQDEKAHIAVDVITALLSKKSRLVIDFIVSILSMGTIGIVIWRVIDQSIYFASKNMMHKQYLAIPSAPFAVVIAFGIMAMWLLMFRDFLKLIVESIKEGLAMYQWLIMVATPVILTVLIGFFMQKGLWEINLDLLAVMGICFFTALLLAGMPIAYTMMLTAIIFISHIRGPVTAFDMVATDVYRSLGSYAFAVLPFFMMMGFFCLHAKFGGDLYDAGYRWIGHLKGGLSYATIGACTAFAAIVGDPIASVSTMGTGALPQMRRYKYNDMLSTGSIVAGSCLGPIIPPSSAFVLVGLLTGVPIGSLLISGIIPGLLITACYAIVIFIWCRIYPDAGPAGEKSAWGPRLRSLKAGGPVAVIFLVCIGGIYLGIFTPIRGGAVGAFAAFLLALIMKRYSWKDFAQALLDGGKHISAVFLILVSAVMFTRFLAWCNVSTTLTNAITSLGLSSTGFMIITLILFFIIGFPVDILPMMLIGFPIFFPIAKALGLDPIWFCLMLVVIINTAEMTPPVGITMFVLRSISKDIPLNTIFKGVYPFCIAMLVAVVILFIFPKLSTWLPSLMY
ncbi:MAG: TRAP transporter large permease subunit [Deltaproteobacteria bacterium]|nr:TRAP transporter large permease subunit [Deltaproteobacteria bacterium]